MADNDSDQLVFQDQRFYENLVKIFVPVIFSGPVIVVSIVGLVVFIILSPLFIILSPVLVPAFFIFWICLYLTGENPIGAYWMDEVLEKIVEAVVEVKNKVEQLGHDMSFD